MSELRARADARLDEALERDAVLDPRDGYRERLKLLRTRDQDAFEEARRYYEEVLVPRVAAPDSDPILEWFEYGRRLAELEGDGRVVAIDETGKASDYSPPFPRGALILFLPQDPKVSAFALNTPRHLSPAQAANYALLVERRVR